MKQIKFLCFTAPLALKTSIVVDRLGITNTILDVKYNFLMHYFQENRREYEKRVAAIVEQSWMMSFPDEAESSMGKSKQNDNSASGATATTSAGAASRSGGNLNNDTNAQNSGNSSNS